MKVEDRHAADQDHRRDCVSQAMARNTACDDPEPGRLDHDACHPVFEFSRRLVDRRFHCRSVGLCIAAPTYRFRDKASGWFSLGFLKIGHSSDK